MKGFSSKGVVKKKGRIPSPPPPPSASAAEISTIILFIHTVKLHMGTQVKFL